jgi:hypothetical protein
METVDLYPILKRFPPQSLTVRDELGRTALSFRQLMCWTSASISLLPWRHLCPLGWTGEFLQPYDTSFDDTLVCMRPVDHKL